jgi:hypothetical protein
MSVYDGGVQNIGQKGRARGCNGPVVVHGTGGTIDMPVYPSTQALQAVLSRFATGT